MYLYLHLKLQPKAFLYSIIYTYISLYITSLFHYILWHIVKGMRLNVTCKNKFFLTSLVIDKGSKDILLTKLTTTPCTTCVCVGWNYTFLAENCENIQ